MLRLAVGKNSRELGLTAATSHADGLLDDVHLNLNLGVVTGKTIKSSHDSACLFLTVVSKEPARRLGQLGHHDENDGSEHDLEGNGESPSEVVGAVETSVVDPVGNQCANSDVTALNANDLATVL